MKFVDALKLMNEGDVITRDGKTLIRKGDDYRFTFADRLSNKWYVHTHIFSFPEQLEVNAYPCNNCKECKNRYLCPCMWKCWVTHKDIAKSPQFKRAEE